MVVIWAPRYAKDAAVALRATLAGVQGVEVRDDLRNPFRDRRGKRTALEGPDRRHPGERRQGVRGAFSGAVV